MEQTNTQPLAASLGDLLDTVTPSEFAGAVEQAVLTLDGVGEVVIWLVDFGFSAFIDLAGRREDIAVEGTMAGRALLSGTGFSHGAHSYLPIGRRGQVIGVLDVESDSVSMVEALQPVATVVANALHASRGHSDVVDRTRGANALGLAATMQYQTLPYPTYAEDGVEVAGTIEPAYDIAGDAFDYAVNPEGTHVAIFDAVGHGLRSTVLTSLAIGSYRHQRRRGSSLAEAAIAIDRVVAANSNHGEFVTGLLLAIRTHQRVVEVWNGGHPSPLLVRDRSAQVIDTEPALLPFGLGPEDAPPVVHQLQPADQLFLFTDGVVQAKNQDSQLWGSEALVEMVAGRADETMSMFQICRQVLDAVRRFVAAPLVDDATMVGVRWIG
ncbi:MAG TPA: PP2C family protein-serine/threonine phosphatase [Acidimicrobiia bacterium]|nr:PP2C family protein-serine/threonine phosphatase [Acidimicrobiia bacterium]